MPILITEKKTKLYLVVLIYLITNELLSVNRAVANTLLTILPNKIKVTNDHQYTPTLVLGTENLSRRECFKQLRGV